MATRSELGQTDFEYNPRPYIPRVALGAIRDQRSSAPAGRVNLGQIERWASGIGGGLLVAQGLRQRTFGGLGLAVLGGYLAYRGASGHCEAYEALGINTAGKVRADESEKVHKGRLIKHTCTINRSPSDIYNFLSNVENYPHFMKNVLEVRSIGQGRSHWVYSGPFGTTWQFDSEHIQEKPGELLAWKSLPGGDVDNAGSYRLKPTWDGEGTEVTLELNFEPPAGLVGLTVAKLLGANPESVTRENLRRLKQLLETGEIPTTEGQTSGRVHVA